MGGDARKESPVFVNGEESQLLARSPAGDAEEGWTVTRRPYRSHNEDELLTDAGCSTCLLAGNRVRMADGGLKAIERIVAGEWVMTMSGPTRVQRTEVTTLGLTRRVIELRGVGDQALLLSNDHPLWVSRQGKDGARKEWWGTYNIHHTLYEMHNTTGFELRELPFVLNFDLPEQVAHETGWLHVRPIFHELDVHTDLYHLVVEGASNFIAEGFPVFSHCRDEQGPGTAWTGLEARAKGWKSLDELLPAIG
jgi:hypothetical protein